MTKTYAVIGDPIDHSFSPALHNAAFLFLGLDCTYIAYRIPKGELEYGIEALKKINIVGFNVTIPHKVDMMKFLDDADDICKKVGAANTVINNEGIFKGYNTDVDGFTDPIK
ncbi:MAG: shikimate dehydrogenase, partial [Thaumarchaeota archaeon]|nr:shikimate dehydrogenase [Nitrososphaerota archaeon]